jgi:hypothetical protein
MAGSQILAKRARAQVHAAHLEAHTADMADVGGPGQDHTHARLQLRQGLDTSRRVHVHHHRPRHPRGQRVRREADGWHGAVQSVGLKSANFPSIVSIHVIGHGQLGVCGRHGHGIVRHVYHYGGRHCTDPCLRFIASTYCSKFELIEPQPRPSTPTLLDALRSHHLPQCLPRPSLPRLCKSEPP